MADKAGKRKAKAKREKASVLGNLPATRPQRLGRPRADAPPAAPEEPAPPPRPKRESPRRPKTGPARVEATPAGRSRPAKAATASGGAAKPAAKTAGGRAAKPASGRAAKPAGKTAAARAAKTVSGRAAKPAGAAKKSAAPRRPAAVRPGARALPPQQRVGDPPPVRTVQAPRGTELVTTTIQAVGELAQIGLTVGGRALKRAVDRLPKP